jgi:hypothetical protein
MESASAEDLKACLGDPHPLFPLRRQSSDRVGIIDDHPLGQRGLG